MIKFICSDLHDVNNLVQPTEIDTTNKDSDEYKSLDRFINKMLDVDNLIILAGSGTSLTFNKNCNGNVAPSMTDLWNYCTRKDKRLFNLASAAIGWNKVQQENNIEKFLSLCDLSLASGNLSNTRRKQVESFLIMAKGEILRVTNFTDKIEESSWSTHNKFIRILGKRSPQQQRIKIFTTNYDLAFEHAASNTGFVVIDGFEFSNPSYFNPMWFNYDIVNRAKASVNEGSYISNVIRLYKLHGSVDWRRINGLVRKCDVNSSNGDPVFIYPSSNKYQSSYESPYLDMMTSLLDAVKQPKTGVLCLGFGFNDKHINNALIMALRTNPEFMIMISTKDPFSEGSSFNKEICHSLIQAIQEGDRRISIMDSTFEEFSNFLPERRSATPEENLIKAFETIMANVK